MLMMALTSGQLHTQSQQDPITADKSLALHASFFFLDSLRDLIHIIIGPYSLHHVVREDGQPRKLAN
jgi:hypothetical protein